MQPLNRIRPPGENPVAAVCKVFLSVSTPQGAVSCSGLQSEHASVSTPKGENDVCGLQSESGSAAAVC